MTGVTSFTDRRQEAARRKETPDLLCTQLLLSLYLSVLAELKPRVRGGARGRVLLTICRLSGLIVKK